MIKVVLDTNIFVISRFKKEGARMRIIKDCIDGVIQGLYTKKIKAEADRVLDGFNASPIFMSKVQNYFHAATYVEDTVDLKVCEDPTDDMFLECAVSGRAEYIISDDKHLLKLESYGGIKIRTAALFYQENNIPKHKQSHNQNIHNS